MDNPQRDKWATARCPGCGRREGHLDDCAVKRAADLVNADLPSVDLDNPPKKNWPIA